MANHSDLTFITNANEATNTCSILLLMTTFNYESTGGAFISDVVGLGKTHVSAMLASQHNGQTLVLVPHGLFRAGKTWSVKSDIWERISILIQRCSVELFPSRQTR